MPLTLTVHIFEMKDGRVGTEIKGNADPGTFTPKEKQMMEETVRLLASDRETMRLNQKVVIQGGHITGEKPNFGN